MRSFRRIRQFKKARDFAGHGVNDRVLVEWKNKSKKKIVGPSDLASARKTPKRRYRTSTTGRRKRSQKRTRPEEHA